MAAHIRVLVVDGHRTFADVLATRLRAEPDLDVAAATTIEEAGRVLAEGQVDIVLLDVDLNGGDGIRFARDLRADRADLRLVAVTAETDEHRVCDAVRAGMNGWVAKDESVDHLVRVIRGVVRGETWIPPLLLTAVLRDLTEVQRGRTRQEALIATLTPREHEVLRCMVAGMSRSAIAEQLFLSPNTVRTHMQNVLGKLGVHSTLAAVALARRAGLDGQSE